MQLYRAGLITETLILRRAYNAELIEAANDDLSTATIQNSQTARLNKKAPNSSTKSGQDHARIYMSAKLGHPHFF